MKLLQQSFNINILANYTSQIYVALIGILILPIYLKLLGAESYGLIGFFSMLQASFAILDLGLSSTISRETARFRAGAIKTLEYLRLYRALSIFFVLIAILGAIIIWISSYDIANKWLNFQNLSNTSVIQSIQIMAFVIAARWLCGLFRGVITGSEKILLLSVINIIFASIRFISVLWFMSYFGYNIEVFLSFNL